MRLAKFLANAGVASRRAADQIIHSGRVTVAGEVVTDPARDVDAGSGVAVDGQPVRAAPAELVVYAVNKPAGVVSTASDPLIPQAIIRDRDTFFEQAPVVPGMPQTKNLERA